MSAAAFLWAWAAGWLWVRAARLTSHLLPRWAAAASEAALSLAFGLGATAALFFALLWAGVVPRTAAFFADSLLLACGAAVLFLRRGVRAPAPSPRPEHARVPFGFAAPLAFSAAVIVFAAGLVAYFRANPQGNWDAWAIWNLRARFLTDVHTWRNAVSPVLSATHPDYPLLWSAAIARAWVEMGGHAQMVPVAAAFLAAFALVGLFFSALATLRGPLLASLGGAILLTAAPLWQQGPSQYADIPLSLFLLSATIAALLSSLKGWDGASLLLSGAFASMAAFTKNEGLLFCALCGAVLVPVARTRVLYWLAGAAPGAALAAAFKFFLAPPAHMSDFRHLTSISRLFTVLGGLGKELWDLGSFPAHPILLFALLLALLGRRREAVPVWPVLPALGLLGGDLIVLWTTRNELQWMLATSLDRLMAQALPVILFCAMLWIAAPAAEAPAVPARRRPKA